MKRTNDDSRRNFGLKAAKSPRQPPPNYFTRREQIRLFLLCSTLMLVLVAMDEARKPSNWDWMWSGDPVANVSADPTGVDSAGVDSAKESHALDTEPIDTRIETHNRVLPVDGFSMDRTRAPEVAITAGDYLPEITPELLQPIEDNTVMRAVENNAWLTMLAALDARSAAEIESLSTGDVGFVQLFRQTDVYRGRLVTVRGTARRLEAITPRANDQGITRLFRWILRPEGSNSPIIVYSLDKPEQLEPADDLREPCSFTGLCFKRWAYQAGDGTRVAPLLLAKSPQWSSAPAASAPRLPSTTWLLLSTFGLAGVAILIAVVVSRAANTKVPNIDRLRSSRENLDTTLNHAEILPCTREALGAMEDTDSEPI